MATKFGEDFKFPDEVDDKDEEQKAEKLEVEIEDDTPEEDRNRKPMKEPVEDPTEEELASYDERVQARIKKFTRGYHDERRAKEQALREREAAEAFARQVYEENKKLQQQLASGSQMLIETSKSAADTELLAAKRAYKEAYEAGDPDALANAQEAISRATLKVEKAQDLKPIEVKEQEWKGAEPQEPSAQPVPRSVKRWMEANADWWGKDDEMTMAAMGLDKKLQRQYGPDYFGTEEYFKAIDKTMRKRFPEHFGEQSYEDDEPPPKKRAEPDEDETPRRASKAATVVAPASRSTPPSRVKLKSSEAAIARRLGVPIELYAKQVAQLNRGE